jgi:hypothetical protein
MNSYESSSMFGTLLGVGIGAMIPGAGLLGMALGGLFGQSIGGMFGASHAQKKEQERLRKAQYEQAELLREKAKADSAELFSSVQSATAQTSGAMGAIY